MASEERNALAELAKSLRFVTVSGAVGRHTEEYDIREYKRISDSLVKAYRIIVELAKVEYVVDCDGNRIYLPAEASIAISKCREIAEEGVNHG